MSAPLVAVASSVVVAGAAFLILREIRALRVALVEHTKAEKSLDNLNARPSSDGNLTTLVAQKQAALATQRAGSNGSCSFTAAGIGRMRAVGSVLTALPRVEHNKLVAALSRRAAPVSQWGPVLAGLPGVVEARLSSLQTGDLVLTSTRVGSWVGNTVQVLTDSTWNHVAIVIRGVLTAAVDDDAHDKRFDHLKKCYVPRSAWHFRVCDSGEPHLFEASWQGVHVYPSALGEDGRPITGGRMHDRLLRDPAYDEYSTIGVRALQGVERTPDMYAKLEAWIQRSRGTAFEAKAPLHNIFSEDAGGVESMHCAELTTETLKVLGLVDADFVSATAPPCVYADAPFGTVRLLKGSYGPLEIIKAEDEQEEARLGSATFAPHARLRHQGSVVVGKPP